MDHRDRNPRCHGQLPIASPSGHLEGPELEVAHSIKEPTSRSHSRASSQEEVFFASGPFYAHLDDLNDEEEDAELMNEVKTRGSNNTLRCPFDDTNHTGRRSNTKCNVLYAEVPHSFRTVSNGSTLASSSAHTKPRSPIGTPCNGGSKLKLKNLLMFGGGSSSHKHATHLIDHCDSLCCSPPHQSDGHDFVEPSSPPKQAAPLKQHRKTPFSPKLNPFNRILSSSQELFSHKVKPSSFESSGVRVIKPTAIRPTHVVTMPSDEAADHRPATSAEFYELPCGSNRSIQGQCSFDSVPTRQPSTSSAFHQVNNSSSSRYAQHNRSNSLAESFLYPTMSAALPPPLPPQRLNNGRLTATATSPRPRSSDCRRNSRAIGHITFSAQQQQQGSSLDSLDTVIQKSRQSIDSEQEPIHMTLEEVRRIAFGSDSQVSPSNQLDTSSSKTGDSPSGSKQAAASGSKHSHKSKLKLALENILHKTHCIGPNSPSGASSSGSSFNGKNVYRVTSTSEQSQEQSMLSFIPTGYRRIHIEDQTPLRQREESSDQGLLASPFIRRALPPLPRDREAASSRAAEVNGGQAKPSVMDQLRSRGYRSVFTGFDSRRTLPLATMTPEERQRFLDFVTSIERVKNCGWYWGPVCGELAEKLLESEPCGSFIVRDSSDEHYIFSLTFKLNGIVKHVRIEHDQGNFSFGSLPKYRSSTIVDFIESAIEHSRSGQFLFFLHRHIGGGNALQPVQPVRVQLLNPISRFRQVQSLQHNCRFTILKHVRRDQIEQLPLPEVLQAYLDTPYYYSEELANLQESLNREKAEGKLEEKRRRKAFMRTDHRTLVEKMLIDRELVERHLQISLPAEVYGGVAVAGASTSEEDEEDVQELNKAKQQLDHYSKDEPAQNGHLELS